jgi:hypothetical protein
MIHPSEGLTYLNPDEDRITGDIYRIAHEALGFCKGCGDRNIRQLLDEAKSNLKEMGIIDIDKVMQERPNDSRH